MTNPVSGDALTALVADMQEIRSACGFMWMRMAVAADAQDAYDVAKREFEEHQAAFTRLETSLPELAAPPERVSEGKEPMKGDGLIAQERQRQQMVEGWTDSHDDEHDNGEMVSAAIAYLTRVMQRRPPSTPPPVWPWEPKWWKFSDDAVRNLVKAGALIAAEIDRLERAARPAVEPREEPTYD